MSSEIDTSNLSEHHQVLVNNTILQLNIKLSKTTFNQFEEIKIKVEVINLGPKDIEIRILDHYYRIFVINILNSKNNLVWNNPCFGLPPLTKPFNLTLTQNSPYTETFKWDQREHTGGGCVVESKGSQVPSGEYTIYTRLNLDSAKYGNLSLERERSIKIEEQIFWIILSGAIIISIVIAVIIILHRKKSKSITNLNEPQINNTNYQK